MQAVWMLRNSAGGLRSDTATRDESRRASRLFWMPCIKGPLTHLAVKETGTQILCLARIGL
jgi:hypothetical protein